MSKARLIITAVVLEGRSPSEVARSYGVARSWVYKLVARYRSEGDAAFEPCSRRPHTRPDATASSVVELVLSLRRQLTAAGLDAGADTIVWHLEHHHQVMLSRATVYRIVRRHDLVVAEPNKKPKSSYVRFQAEQPNETWQADFTHHRLADGSDAEILSWLRTQPPATSLTELQHQLDAFVEIYNHHRPHRSLPHHSTPAVAYTTRPKAGPDNNQPDSESRVRRDKVHSGNISLRVDGHMHHIGVGRTLDGTPVLLLINGYDVHIIHATTSEIIRTLTINPNHRYHGTGRPPGRPTGPRKIKRSGP